MKDKWSPINKVLRRRQWQECAFVTIYFNVEGIERQFCLKVVSHESQIKVGCGDVCVRMCIIFCDAWFREFGEGIFTFMSFEGDSGVLLTQGKKNYCYRMYKKTVFGINVLFIDGMFCVCCEVITSTTFNTTSKVIGDPNCNMYLH
jgi:hypothetical protein